MTRVHILILALCLLRCYFPASIQKPQSKLVQIKEIKSNYLIGALEDQRVIIYGIAQGNYDDIYEIEGSYQRIDTVKNQGIFCFASYLQQRHIYYQIQADKVTLIQEGSNIRHRLYQYIQNLKQEEIRTVALSLLFGLSQDGASFLIVSCGMHMIFLMRQSKKLLSHVFSDRICDIICFLFLAVLSYATVMTSSILRILCFQCVSFLFPDCDGKDRLGMGMLLTLGIAPYMALEASFLLPIAFRLGYLFNVGKCPKWLISLAILYPMQLYFYQSFALISWFCFPLLRVLYGILYLLVWIVLCFPHAFLFSLIQEIITLCDFIASKDVLLYGTCYIWWIVLYGYALCRMLTHYRIRDILLLSFVIVISYVQPYADPFAHVVMLDVGQGDCALVVLPYHKGVFLIDVMGSIYKNIPEDIIVPYLHAHGIYDLDAVVITHDDYDHSGGIKELQDLMEVKQVLKDKSEYLTVNDFVIPVLTFDYVGEDENDDSMVLLVELYDRDVLFMGDLGIKGEEALLKKYPNLSCDVIKIGHHGSSTSSSMQFVHQLSAQLALISAGRNNIYGHPHEQVLETLQQEAVYSIITSKQGSCEIWICKYFAFFLTADGTLGFF